MTRTSTRRLAGQSGRHTDAKRRVSERDTESPSNRGAVDAAVVCKSRHPIRSLVSGARDWNIQQPRAKLRYVARRTGFLVSDRIRSADCGKQRSLHIVILLKRMYVLPWAQLSCKIVHMNPAHEPVAEAVLSALDRLLNATCRSIDRRRAQNQRRPRSFRDSPLCFQACARPFRVVVHGRAFVLHSGRTVDCG